MISEAKYKIGDRVQTTYSGAGVITNHSVLHRYTIEFDDGCGTFPEYDIAPETASEATVSVEIPKALAKRFADDVRCGLAVSSMYEMKDVVVEALR